MAADCIIAWECGCAADVVPPLGEVMAGIWNALRMPAIKQLVFVKDTYCMWVL